MQVYLCGPINGCTDAEAKDWRQMIKNYIGEFQCIATMVRDYRGKEIENYREIVDLDKRDVRNASVILVNYSGPSVGTSMEMFYAWTLGIPIVLWCKSDAVISPWLRYHSTTIVHSLNDACKKVLEFIQ